MLKGKYKIPHREISFNEFRILRIKVHFSRVAAFGFYVLCRVPLIVTVIFAMPQDANATSTY